MREIGRTNVRYAARGIDLTFFAKDSDLPHFYNLEDDPFRSERFMCAPCPPEHDSLPPGTPFTPPALGRRCTARHDMVLS